MPTATTDPSAVERDVALLAEKLLRELGAGRALPRVHPEAFLDRDLGIGSLERVELVVRIEEAFRVELPDGAAASASTLADLARAVEASLAAPREERAICEPRLSPEPGPDRQRAARTTGAKTLVDLLQRRAEATPDAVHIHLTTGRDEVVPISYGALWGAAASVAAGLAERGLPAGAPVALVFPTSREFFEAFFGVMMAGGVPVPLYPPHRADQIEEYAHRQATVLNAAEARMLLASERTESIARVLRSRVRSLLGAWRLAEVRRPGAASCAQVREGDLAFLQYTSGSTGMPKGVMLTHANVMANLKAMAVGLRLTPEDVCVTWLPLYHDMGLIGTWLGALYGGFPTHIASPLWFLERPERWLRAIHRHRATISAAPNFAYNLCAYKLSDRALEGLDLSNWRVAINGAEPIHPEVLRRFSERLGPHGFRPESMLPAYGLAETALALTLPPCGMAPRIDRVSRGPFEREGRALPVEGGSAAEAIKFVGTGSAVLGSEVRVVDADGRAVAERTVGNIQFRGESASPGYYRNAEATAAFVRADGWRETGDLGYVAEGEVFVTGRWKDLVIKAGRNLVPQEIEEIAGAAPGVRKGSVAVFAAPGRDGAESLVVAAESRARTEAEREEVIRAVRERIVDALGVAPDDVLLVPAHSIPKTSSGKIRRSAAREAYLRGGFEARPVARAWRFLARSALDRALDGARRGVRSALEAVYGAYVMTEIFFTLIPAWALCHAKGSTARASAAVQAWARLATGLAGLVPRVVGREHLRGPGPRVLVCNHVSYLDVMLLASVLQGEPRFVAKRELFTDPVFGPIARGTGAHAVRREDARGGVEDQALIEAGLARGETLVFFPEGTFTSATGLRPFRLGAFQAAVSAGAEVVPVALRGAREVLRDGTRLPRPGRIEVHVGPPIRPEGDGWREVVRLRDLSRAWIAAHCGEPLLDTVDARLPQAP